MSERPSPDAGPDRRQPAPDDPYLAFWSETAERRTWALPATERVAIIGRSASADVSIDWDPKVSRVHATLERVGGEWTLEDDGLSRNGTYVNGRRISSRVRLRDRDRILVGGTALTFCAPPPTLTQATAVSQVVPVASRLTEPQRAVLAALCRPCLGGGPYAAPATNQEIAEQLSLSVDAVKTHLRVLFHKFGIEDLPQNRKRARLAELALTLGLVSEDRG